MKTTKIKIAAFALLFTCTGVLTVSCGGGNQAKNADSVAASVQDVPVTQEEADPMKNKGIGPVKSVTLTALDEAKAKEGETLFTAKCSACHKLEEKYVGPALKGVTQRRTPEWIMNMILNPGEMTQKDPIGKQLLAEFLSPMANQNVTEDEAGKMLEYFRSVDSK